MTLRVAINGFGRIGRLVLRAILSGSNEDIEVAAINDLAPQETQAHLFRFDSVHGRFPSDVALGEKGMLIGNQTIKLFSEKDPNLLPWKELGVDIVMECSGVFTKREAAAAHLHAGARRVLISAPSPDADNTVVYGVNHTSLTKEDLVVSNASCTTNCLAPIAKVLHQAFGIERGYMTTIHAYTGDQRIIDTAHKDLHRARAGAVSMIPTSTGAAKAVGLVLPELKGRLDGTAIRVPTPNVSLIDFTFTAAKETSIKDINIAMKAASKEDLKGVLGINELPLVSIDFNHCAESSIYDATQTQVIDGVFCRILSWYDNEWGFSNRMVDVARYMKDLM